MFTFLSLMYLYNTYCFNATTNLPLQVLQQEDFEPPTRTLMLKCIRKPKWEEAEQAELKSIQDCNVWTKDPQPPDGVKPLPLKWVYKVKKDLQGFFQVFGFDYTETYSPVAKFTSIRLLLAIAVQLGLYIHQMDVDTAFLNAPIDEHIWVKVPDGTNLPPGDNGVYKLLKSLYGLKQAPRCWNNMLNQYLIDEKFERLEADPCLYVKVLTINENGIVKTQFMIVAIYVDDLIIAASTKNLITNIEAIFEKKFKMKKLNRIKHLLGMGILHDKQTNTIFISQEQYISTMVDKISKYRLSEYSTSMDAKKIYSKLQCPKVDTPEALKMRTLPYRELIGTLLWISNGTRPDITYSVTTLARFSSNPAFEHWQAALRVLGYLNHTKHHCIKYTQQLNYSTIVSRGYSRGYLPSFSDYKFYVDASFATDPDSRRSVTGYIFFISGGPVSWQSRLQTSVALSSMEAEYMATTAATQEALWQTRLLQQLGMRVTLPVVLFEDNKSAILFSDHPGDHRTTKHIITRKEFTRDHVKKGDIKLEFVATQDQLAD